MTRDPVVVLALQYNLSLCETLPQLKMVIFIVPILQIPSKYNFTAVLYNLYYNISLVYRLQCHYGISWSLLSYLIEVK